MSALDTHALHSSCDSQNLEMTKNSTILPTIYNSPRKNNNRYNNHNTISTYKSPFLDGSFQQQKLIQQPPKKLRLSLNSQDLGLMDLLKQQNTIKDENSNTNSLFQLLMSTPLPSTTQYSLYKRGTYLISSKHRHQMDMLNQSSLSNSYNNNNLSDKLDENTVKGDKGRSLSTYSKSMIDRFSENNSPLQLELYNKLADSTQQEVNQTTISSRRKKKNKSIEAQQEKDQFLVRLSQDSLLGSSATRKTTPKPGQKIAQCPYYSFSKLTDKDKKIKEDDMSIQLDKMNLLDKPSSSPQETQKQLNTDDLYISYRKTLNERKQAEEENKIILSRIGYMERQQHKDNLQIEKTKKTLQDKIELSEYQQKYSTSLEPSSCRVDKSSQSREQRKCFQERLTKDLDFKRQRASEIKNNAQQAELKTAGMRKEELLMKEDKAQIIREQRIVGPRQKMQWLINAKKQHANIQLQQAVMAEHMRTQRYQNQVQELEQLEKKIQQKVQETKRIQVDCKEELQQFLIKKHSKSRLETITP